ncbi:MAG: bifunctional DNA-formamidopyrimidine glycosylase/DNA-(apurinic or apyrimidinic site) lyase [Acidobacteriota bacterium]
MPELPEVETIRRGLTPLIAGRTILGVQVRERRLREPVDTRRMAWLCGARWTGIRRRSKYLLLETDADLTLLVHLGMTGSLWVSGPGRPARPHEHVVFTLDDGRELRFADPRRFGMMKVLKSGTVDRHPRLRGLGPEPLNGDLTGGTLFRATRGRRAPIKSFLLDTRAIAGIGNIYACEALHRAGLHPNRAVGRIAKPRWDRLAAELRNVLEEAIKAGGTTLRDFLNAEEEAGYFKLELRVYDREGSPCRTCGGDIRRIVQSGRSTFYCRRCQH